MKVMTILSIVTLIPSLLIGRFSLASIAAIYSTCNFLMKRIGVKCNLNVILAAEVITTILTFVWKILRGKFSLAVCLGYVFFRFLFICVVNYDQVNYVYVTRLRPKDDTMTDDELAMYEEEVK